jgi:hypothetical protein
MALATAVRGLLPIVNGSTTNLAHPRVMTFKGRLGVCPAGRARGDRPRGSVSAAWSATLRACPTAGRGASGSAC